MLKYLIILSSAFLLTSCGPNAGDNVYVGIQGMPNSLAEVVAANGSYLVVKLCEGETYKVEYKDVVRTTQTCPYKETP